MRFTATEEQVKEIAARAVSAALPLGMGILHFKEEHTFTPEDFVIEQRGLSLDYVKGRCVKLFIGRREDSQWEINDPFRLDYQTWSYRYPTVAKLLEGIVDEEGILSGTTPG